MAMASAVKQVESDDIVLDDSERQRCEVYSRVVGYLRVIDNWNKGKRQEFYDRKHFDDSMEKL